MKSPRVFAWFGIYDLLTACVFFLALYLRLYRLEENFIFHGELGDNLLAIKNFISDGHIPLIGPPTSHPWLSFGPIFYWLFIPVMYIGRFDPMFYAKSMAVLASIVVIANYFFVAKLWNKKAAFISSTLIAVSPLWLELSIGSRFYSLVPLFFYPLIYLLVKAIDDKPGLIFWSMLSWSVMLNFHLSPIIFAPVVLYLIYRYRIDLKVSNIILGILGFILPQLPALFELPKLIVWMGYRVLGFAGIVQKNTVSTAVLGDNFLSLFRFLSQTFSNNYLIVALIIILSFTLSLQWIDRLSKLLIAMFIVGVMCLFVHGSPPSHYYLPLYPIPILFFSKFLVADVKQKSPLLWVFVVALVIASVNAVYTARNQSANKSDLENGLVAYSLQKEVVNVFLSQVGNQKYMLKRVGANDNFDQNYSQNYRYLAWLYGNEPSGTSNLVVTIYENPPDKLPTNNKTKFINISDIKVSIEEQ